MWVTNSQGLSVTKLRASDGKTLRVEEIRYCDAPESPPSQTSPCRFPAASSSS